MEKRRIESIYMEEDKNLSSLIHSELSDSENEILNQIFEKGYSGNEYFRFIDSNMESWDFNIYEIYDNENLIGFMIEYYSNYHNYISGRYMIGINDGDYIESYIELLSNLSLYISQNDDRYLERL